MEAYFPVVAKGSSTNGKPEEGTLLDHNKFKRANTTQSKPRYENPLDLTRDLLATLSDASNPITHSDICNRTDHIVSFSSGHQVSEGRRSNAMHSEDRFKKLYAQQGNQPLGDSGILKDTRIYVNGYLESANDLEIKRLASLAGARVVHSASRCTHIVTSRCLSAVKTERLLTKRSGRRPYVVRPEWILDSIAHEKRLPERSYTIPMQCEMTSSRSVVTFGTPY